MTTDFDHPVTKVTFAEKSERDRELLELKIEARIRRIEADALWAWLAILRRQWPAGR